MIIKVSTSQQLLCLCGVILYFVVLIADLSSARLCSGAAVAAPPVRAKFMLSWFSSSLGH